MWKTRYYISLYRQLLRLNMDIVNLRHYRETKESNEVTKRKVSIRFNLQESLFSREHPLICNMLSSSLSPARQGWIMHFV